MTDLIRAHCAWLRAAGMSSRTVIDREGWLRRADRALPLGVVEADQAELVEYLGTPGWSAATRDKCFYHLAGFFAWGCDPRSAADGSVLADNPMVGLKRPKSPKGEPRPVSDDELAVVLAKAREPYLTAVILAVGAGLRATELSMLRREDVSDEQVWVRWGKGGRSKSVPTSPEVYEHVRDFPRGRIIEHVGGVADGRKMSARSSIYFARTLKLPGVCLHRFRHKYAELLRREGNDIATISRCLRHEHLSSTQVYARASEAECRRAVKSLRLRNQISS